MRAVSPDERPPTHPAGTGGADPVSGEAAAGPGAAGAHRRERDRELAARGWSRRFVGSPPRLKEMVELYETLGQEVLLDELSPEELAAECDGCTLALSLFRVVYTRR